MRLTIACVILSLSTPVYAQTYGTSSGAMSMVDISSPASTTSTVTLASTSTATNRVITPPTVVAPGLAAAGVETCLGSSAGGLSLMGGGVSFGSTRVDEGCTIRLLARQLFAFGLKNAALALMCQDDRVAMAMAAVGTPCPPQPAPVAASDPTAALSSLGYAADDRTAPAAAEPQAEPTTAEPQAKPFTAEEAALFDREAIVN